MRVPREPARYTATILFCDIRGFTALFDQRDPLEAVSFANSVLGALGSVVEACNGTVDKFTGDGFLAHFGILGDTASSHAEDACWCALRMQRQLLKINDTRHFEDQPVVQVGIGIHSGEVATGIISTLQKSEFTVLGSVVNTASRIEGLTKFFSVDCLVSTSTNEIVNNKFEFQKMPAKPLRGIVDARSTYWLLPSNLLPEEIL